MAKCQLKLMQETKQNKSKLMKSCKIYLNESLHVDYLSQQYKKYHGK